MTKNDVIETQEIYSDISGKLISKRSYVKKDGDYDKDATIIEGKGHYEFKLDLTFVPLEGERTFYEKKTKVCASLNEIATYIKSLEDKLKE